MIKLDEIPERLLAANPHFKERNEELYMDNPYDVAGTFALFVVELMDARTPLEHPAVVDAFAFMNELAANGGHGEVETLLAVGILEVLTDSDAAIQAGRTLLSPKARDLLEDMIRGWQGHSVPRK